MMNQNQLKHVTHSDSESDSEENFEKILEKYKSKGT